jgi:hypothetical protein
MPAEGAPPFRRYPATLWQSGQGWWALLPHGMARSRTVLVRADQARAKAAAMLTAHQRRQVSPDQVTLTWWEAPAVTLQRMAADPGLTVAQLLDAARLPIASP